MIIQTNSTMAYKSTKRRKQKKLKKKQQKTGQLFLIKNKKICIK